MLSLYFIFPTLLAILISFLFVRASAIALMMTGLDKNKARFQALSAFSGTGFTTREAESVVNHPQRRNIVRWLMIMGNAGIVTVIVTATSSFSTSQGYQLPINLLVLMVGIFIIYRLARYRGFVDKWEHFIERKLIKSPRFEESAVEDLLHFLEGYGLVKKIILEESPLLGKLIKETRLNEKGILVLGIEREKNWIPTPRATEKIKDGDSIVVYGPLEVLKSTLKE
ncbi:TrkA C-terminal domain-containing protein [Acidobacteriota bacterium]